MLAKAGGEEGDLACGGHPALSEAVNRAWIKSDYTPTTVCNNCSGKHAGMLAGARAIGTDSRDYHLPKHPIQLQVKRVIGDLYHPDEAALKWGIDGCNLPAPAAPLHALARVYASFAAAADAVETNNTAKSRTRLSSLIFHSMARHPDLVGGSGRFCTELMTAYRGTLIGKLGADGFYALGIRASLQTRRLGSDGPIGVAIKIEDGNVSILYSAVMEILKRLGIGSPDVYSELALWHCQSIRNTVGVVTGKAEYQFDVRAVAGRVGEIVGG